MSDDPMEQFDEVIQMQLVEFQRHILAATASDLVIIITENGGVCQCSTGASGMSEDYGKGEASAVITQVAAVMVREASRGQFELLIKNKETGECLSCDKNTASFVMKV